MPRRFWPVLVALSAGCVPPAGQQMALVPSGVNGPTPTLPAHLTCSPGTTQTALRVGEVGQKLVAANPKLGMRPVFQTSGSGDVNVYHRGPAEGDLHGAQVVVSEGLVAKCKNDGQLAGVLAYQLGCLVAEREALASPVARHPERRVPPQVPVGNDAGGTFGSPDGTRQVELAKADRYRKLSPPLPDPAVLARHYVQEAGYDPVVIDEVLPLVRPADGVTPPAGAAPH